jgi:uroporphyrinogen III methyltransferase/synthase
MKEGKVYLIGAGPGNTGLLTQQAVRRLNEADVVIYDRLLDEHILELSPYAEKIYAGKSPSAHSIDQAGINRLLLSKAKEGKIVVRLKGGDPFVFGRGGEEAETLAENDIPFEIVPGITSAIAVPAYAGIPVTHRGLASSFAVITGHETPDKSGSSINWEKLATGVDTLVFLMGMKNLPDIVTQLVKYGRAKDTPVAVIKDGTRPGQSTITGTLRNITRIVKEHGLTPPAVVIVGEVVRLREKLRWFDNRPLSDKRILVTRARHQANELSALLEEIGAITVETPVIDIQPVDNTAELDNAILNIDRYHWALFTSMNGVAAFFSRLKDLNLDTRIFKGIKVGAIGPATAALLEQKGIIPDFCPVSYSSEGIITGLQTIDPAGQHFLLARADIADQWLRKAIINLGCTVDEVAVYRTVPSEEGISKAVHLLAEGSIDMITFTSSSTVTNLVKAINKNVHLEKVVIACIGPKTAETAINSGLKVDVVAEIHTIPGLVTAIEEYFSKEM